MNYLAKIYKQRAETLQENLNKLERELAILMEEDKAKPSFGRGTPSGASVSKEIEFTGGSYDTTNKAWTPSSGGVAIPDTAAGNIELENRMRNIKKSGDKQSPEYLEMEAELGRRKLGGVSTHLTRNAKGEMRVAVKTKSGSYEPAADRYKVSDSDIMNDSGTPDWVDRWAKKLGDDPRKIDAMRRGVINALEGDPTKPMDPSLTTADVIELGKQPIKKTQNISKTKENLSPAPTPSSAPETPSASSFASAPIVSKEGETSLKDTLQQVLDQGKKLYGNNNAVPKPAPEPKVEKPSAPAKPAQMGVGSEKYEGQGYVVPGSQAWSQMSPDEQYAMTVSALQRKEAHKFFGGREAKTDTFFGLGGKQTARFSVDTSDARANEIAKELNSMLDQRDAQARNANLLNILRKSSDLNLQPNKKKFSTIKDMPKEFVPWNKKLSDRISSFKAFSTQKDMPQETSWRDDVQSIIDSLKTETKPKPRSLFSPEPMRPE